MHINYYAEAQLSFGPTARKRRHPGFLRLHQRQQLEQLLDQAGSFDLT